ncbi:MAG TPA: HAD-IIB family hydrolase [Flavihumibacter sp.]|nr:HAD-IIB family hydrolase [Flavihumibacter sp.]
MEGYYVQLFSPHGLIRYNNSEIGRDRDTGGQVKYVLECLEALSAHPAIRKVDLFTRRIADKRVSPGYESETEIVNDKARIVRMTCGGTQYRSKESLWEYLDEFIDNTIRFIEKEDDFPDVVHGHYADGNYLAAQISDVYGIPFLATGHSLGRNKKQLLLQQGISAEKIDEKFNMERRIAVEESTLQKADAFIVSTQHIIDSQYRLYQQFAPEKFHVIPPGVNNELFYPFYRFDMPSFRMSIEQEQTVYRVSTDMDRFLFNPAKPLILSIGRADKRKNFETIIQAFGNDREWQSMANLAIFAGVRKDITQMPEEEQSILTNLLLLMDKYDLYGKMAIPKKNDPSREVPEIYRLAGRKMGVFVNATPGENFGLTIVEASACGLPVIASPSGGPKEILAQCENGLLVDVEDPAAIAQALKTIIADQPLWNRYSANGIMGVDQYYSWTAFADKYVQVLQELAGRSIEPGTSFPGKPAYGKKLTRATHFFISDLDGTLVDGPNSPGLDALSNWFAQRSDDMVFGVASGRNRELTAKAFTEYDLPAPDIMICSAGAEIYYTDKMIPDNGWEKHIDYQWRKAELKTALQKFPGIRLQEDDAQRRFKLSYYVDNGFTDDQLADLYKFLDDERLRVKLLLTENKYLDFLPFRASKGNAVRYLSHKWKMPLENIITAGNSGNDKDMLTGKMKGIVVANYSEELATLKKSRSVYFAEKELAAGVLEGLHHYLAKS